MRKSKETNRTIYHQNHKNNINRNNYKASSKLDDVLINGVKLHFFTTNQNKKIITAARDNQYEPIMQLNKTEEAMSNEEQNLFKNNAIRRRLKSLQTDPLATHNKYNDFNTTTHKKRFTTYKQLTKIPIQLINLPTKSTVQTEQGVQNIKLVNLNKKYYNELKKDLMLYSTINRFNSSSIKSRIEYGKYIGFTSHKQKHYITDRQSNLIQDKFDQMDREHYHKLSLSNDRKLLNNSPENKQTHSQHYRSVTTQPSPQQPKILRDNINHYKSQRQKLKICYSNKHHLKKWKEYLHQIIQKNKNQQINPQYKLAPTLSSQR